MRKPLNRLKRLIITSTIYATPSTLRGANPLGAYLLLPISALVVLLVKYPRQWNWARACYLPGQLECWSLASPGGLVGAAASVITVLVATRTLRLVASPCKDYDGARIDFVLWVALARRDCGHSARFKIISCTLKMIRPLKQLLMMAIFLVCNKG